MRLRVDINGPIGEGGRQALPQEMGDNAAEVPQDGGWL